MEIMNNVIQQNNIHTTQKINNIQINGSTNITVEMDTSNNNKLQIHSNAPIFCNVGINTLYIQTYKRLKCLSCLCYYYPFFSGNKYFMDWTVNSNEINIDTINLIGDGITTSRNVLVNKNNFTCNLTGAGDMNIHNANSNEINAVLIGSGIINFYSSECNSLKVLVTGTGTINTPEANKKTTYSWNETRGALV